MNYKSALNTGYFVTQSRLSRLMPLAQRTCCTAGVGHAEPGVAKSLRAWSPIKTNGRVLAGKEELVFPGLPPHPSTSVT